MEKKYTASVTYLEFLKDKITENINEYSEDELESYVRQEMRVRRWMKI